MIGAGFAGLALAIRLQAAGLAVTLIEARSAVGGIARQITYGDFTFEEGPSLLADPAPLLELFGADGDAALDLVPVDPACRYLWADGQSFDLAAQPADLIAQVARLAPADLAGLEEWRLWAAGLRRAVWPVLAGSTLRSFSDWRRIAPLVRRGQIWRSASGLARHLFAEPHLQQAFAHPALLSGGHPGAVSAAMLGGQHLAGLGPGYWPVGGMTKLAETLMQRFAALGGEVRLHDPVAHIHTLGSQVTGVETLSGWHGNFVAVASCADPVLTYRNLLKDNPRGPQMGASLAARPHSPSALTVHFALAGTWPGIAHQTVMIGPRFDGLLDDLFGPGVLPRDMLIWLHHPTVTDPDMAPPGHSILRATIPVAHLGKLPIDWETVGPLVGQRVVAEVGRRLIPDIQDRILAQTITTPRDLALDLGLHLGSGWGLEQRLTQSGPMRLAHRDARIGNLYFAGASTHPGAGVAGVLASAKACAQQIRREIT